MPDGTDNENIGPDPTPPPEEQEYPVDRLKARVGGVFAGRPLAVYLVLLAGAATLVILLIIVWISATGNSNEERPICTTIATNDARNAILNGQVERIDILVDADNPANTLTGINLDFDDGSCRSTVQGADVRNDLYLVLGAAEFYNNFAENRVRIHYQKQAIQPELLSTSTPTPTATSPVTETPLPANTPSPEPTHTPTAPATPIAIASPAAEPTHTATARPPEATATMRPPATRTIEATIPAGI
jgi:hypothetical protein